MPTKSQNRPLVGTGIDRALPYLAGSDFAFKARKNGTVVSVNNKIGLAIIRYDDGSEDSIDLTEKQSKNTNTGYWITNQLIPSDKLVKGARFEADDLLAYNDKFFKPDDDRGGFQHMPGKLAMVAVAPGDFTYEDGSMITQRLSSHMTTDITMEKVIDLPSTIIIDKIALKGDKVEAGSSLLEFEESSSDENARFIKMLGDSVDEIAEMSRNKIKSKVTGEIASVRVYYTEDFESLNESLQDVINKIESPRAKYNKELSKHFSGVNSNMFEDAVMLTEDSYTQELQSTMYHRFKTRPLQDRVKPWRSDHKNSESPYSCLMVLTSENFKVQAMHWMSSNIDPNDIDPVEGYEEETHATLLFGLEDTIPTETTREIVDHIPRVQATLGTLKLFENEHHDVLYISFKEYESLVKIRSLIRSTHDHSINRSEYIPHITLCYLKPGTGRKYLQKDTPWLNEIVEFQQLKWQNRKHGTFKFELSDRNDNEILNAVPFIEDWQLEAKKQKQKLPDSANIEFSGKLDPNTKIAKGRDMQGIRIIFHVKFEHQIDIGDKIAYYAALKSIISRVADEGEEPYFIGKNGEKVLVDAVTSPFGIMNRKTGDVTSMLALGKILIDAKRNLSEIAKKHGLEHNLKTV